MEKKKVLAFASLFMIQSVPVLNLDSRGIETLKIFIVDKVRAPLTERWKRETSATIHEYD